MSTNQLISQVTAVVRDFLSNSQLFTALDVSNKVKESFPTMRHRDVRDVVRSLFQTEMVLLDYAATPIVVTLSDGASQAEALLYHPLADSWDLDQKYDAQKRAQVSNRPNVGGPTPVVSNSGTSASVSSDGTVSVQANVLSSPVQSAPAPVAPVVVAKVSARDAWDNLFSNQPSLFPRK